MPPMRLAGTATLFALALLFTMFAWSLGRRGEAVVMVPALASMATGLFIRTRPRGVGPMARMAAASIVVIGIAVFAFCAFLVLFVGAQPV